MRWLAECPTCGRKITGRSRDIVATVLAGHHYYIHSVQMTEAEMDQQIDELIPEHELIARKEQNKQEQLPI